MATDIVGGLFGVTPQMYQQQQNQQALGRAAELGQMSPFASARTSLIYGGNQLAGALGGEDPQLQLISTRNAVMKDVDPNNPSSLQSAIQKLAQAGDQAGALQLSDYLRKAQSDYALIQQRTAEKMTNEQRNALSYASSIAPQGTPEFAQAYQTKLNELITKPEATSNEMKNAYAFAKSKFAVGSPEFNELYSNELARLTTKETAPAIDKVGVAASTREPVYYDKKTDLQYIMKPDATGKMVRVPYSGGIDQTTSRTNVSVTNEGEKAFVKQLGELDAKRVETASTLRDSAIGELNSLSRMQNLNQNELVSGAFASNRVGALNLLDTLGMTGIKDKAALANSQQFDKVTGDLILDKIKKLGSNPSNADREFTKNIVPQLASSPVARQELITYLSKKANEVVDESTRLETYARKNKGLEGFTYKVPLVSSNTQSKPAIQNLSTEQLQKMLKEVP